MTEPTEKSPADEFGEDLLDQVEQGAFHLVILTTEEAWTGRWTAGARDAEVHFRSPDARQLVERQLEVLGASHRTSDLGASEFAEIWESHPRAADACRLAEIIADSKEFDPEKIAAEYSDWHAWIDTLLDDLGLDPRALIWSSAFCDGGTRTSVLKMADDLRKILGDKRSERDILLDPPASKRLEAATIKSKRDTVRLDPDRHGLASAVCRHLWDEYESQRALLTRWLNGQIATLQIEDARRVVGAMLDLAIHYRDDRLLAGLRDKLVGERRSLAVEAFGTAVLDSRYGAHMRNRFYAWLEGSPSQEFIDVFAEICTGEFGAQEPDMALTRLRLAALKSQPSSSAMTMAFTAMAQRHPAKVLSAIGNWFSKSSSLTAGINAFLALASTETGAQLLCSRALRDEGLTTALPGYFERALSQPESKEAAYEAITLWGNAAQEGKLDEVLVSKVLDGVVIPVIRDNGTGRFPDVFNLNTFWGRMFGGAVLRAAQVSGTAIADHDR